MPAPTITTLPTAPQRSDEPATFVTKADAWVASIAGMTSEVNAFGSYLNGLALTGVSGSITATSLTMATARILGRSTASTGAIEEIAVGSGLTLSGGILSATGSYTDEQAQDAIGAMIDGTLTYTDATPLLRVTQETKAADIATASTMNIGALAGGYAVATGNTTITAFDSATSGLERTLTFTGTPTLTHNATSLILPTGANIAVEAGDSAVFRSLGSGNWRCVVYTRASGAALSASSYTGGKQTIPLLASAMTPRTTNGAASGTSESTTNKVMRKTLDFDAATAEYAQIILPMPKSWNEGTCTARFTWEAPGGTGNVVWAIQLLALSDDDAIDTAFGTAVTVTDGVTATTDIMVSAETSAITASNSPAEGDRLVVQVYRDAANGSDTLASDAKLIAVDLFITTNAATDA